MEGTSICVLAMNRPDTLRQTIDCVRSFALPPYELIIVDNGSTDPGTISYLDGLEDVKIIRNETNLGLSVGTNQGLEAGQYDTLIHLDDDCLVPHPGWNQILRSFVHREEIAMAVPGTCGLEIQHEDYVELTWALGMCWAIRKSLFDKIGGYDPQLMHQNECDMALRVRLSGYQLAGIKMIQAIHNDPGGERSEISKAREHLGCIQFRDKWTSFFRGKNWNYGTEPLYLMQHWPPDQDFMRRWGLQNGVQLNPPPTGKPRIPEQAELAQRDDWTEPDIAAWAKYDHLKWEQIIHVAGGEYLVYRELRPDYCHWSGQDNPDGYHIDRQKGIDRWHELTGDLYTGYQWPEDMLKPY